jgi:micrococcal nuclease
MKRLALCIVVLALLLPSVSAAETATVTRIVDGDTLVVSIAGRQEKVRLIGVDTPETVHPNKPVEYFGKEASAFTRKMVDGQMVRLEEDGQSANRDHYGRLLRYVWLPDGRLLNTEIIAQGYGFAYVKYPFDRMEEFRRLEREAREKGRGLWADRK